MSVDKSTLEFYAREAARYNSVVQEEKFPPLFDAFVARLTSGASVLDFGCGGGRAALALQRRGFAVTALDPSAEMLAGLDGSGIPTICGDIESLPLDAKFGAVLALFSLQHIPRDDLAASLARLCASISAGGTIAIAIHEGDESVRDALDRLYNHWSEASLREMLAQSGLTVDWVEREPSKGFDGRRFTALYLLAALPPVDAPHPAA